ncbi:MAG: cytochrome c3 family protein [Candidatus Marinimicrobia bacterium]|nr:cytochrome c3 family protein [Candidatus Neomarinimicrobiota bacterium]MCF7840175.1 cytochrome c3 family protein [Candidatus Neomarinimicrobiota bacterium]MCF7902632.1 cytochrome c3 family protein [Candidatus Neomarinimicrobiota bacterium]
MKSQLQLLKHLTALTIFMLTPYYLMGQDSSQSPGESQVNTCLECHEVLEVMPEGYSADDVHQAAATSCVGCHGGDATNYDMDESMSPAAGYIGIPSRQDIPKLCGRCHSHIDYMRTFRPRIATDQVDQYNQSIHGKKLAEGDQNVAECVSCHTSHAIFPADDPRSTTYAINIPNTCRQCHGNAELMDQYGLGHDQYDKYATSVHGKALLERKDTGVATCNDCHGNHGATPPDAESISNICGSCHLNNLTYFKQSQMAEDFDIHSCQECHGNHDIQPPTDQMLNTDSDTAICLTCHSVGDAGAATAFAMYRDIETVDSLYTLAQTKLKASQTSGMNYAEIDYQLQQTKQNLIQMRTLIHTFDTEEVKAKGADGIKTAKEAIHLAEMEIQEFQTRRVGYGLSTLAIVILAIAVFLKIRQRDEMLKQQ